MARAWKIQLAIGLLAAMALIPAARAQNYVGQVLGYGQRYMNDMGRQQRQEQRRADQAAQQAAAREHTPHVVSALYSGELAPVADLNRLINGKTLYLERPVVADHQLVRMENEEVYLDTRGQAHGASFPSISWSAFDDTYCMSANQQQKCFRALKDGTGQIFLLAPNNMLSHLVRIGTATRLTFWPATNKIEGKQPPIMRLQHVYWAVS